MHSKSLGVQTSMFEDDIENAYIEDINFKDVGLEEAMEITMSAWDLVKGGIRENLPTRDKKKRKSTENCILARL